MGGEFTNSWYITCTLTRYEKKMEEVDPLLYHHVTYSCKGRGIYHFLGIASTLINNFQL